MADGLDTPDGMALLCKTCRWRPTEELTAGLLAAHFETEHGTDKVELELVVLCPRCDEPMAFDRSVGNRDYFSCERCHRTRVIHRG